MSKRARMDELADKLGLDTQPTPPAPVPVQEPEQPKSTVLRKTKTAAPEPLTQMNLNPPHGEKDSFEKITVTLPSPIRRLLLDESHRRKTEKEPNWSISVIVREALVAHLQK